MKEMNLALRIASVVLAFGLVSPCRDRPLSPGSLDPHQVQTFTVNGAPLTGHFFFNPSGLYLPACFSSSQPPGTPGGCPTATYGTLGRNAFRGPGLTNFDLALEKRTKLT